MHAWLCETTTGPADLVWREMPTPDPAADEVRVAIHAASINFPDLLTVEGKYQVRPPLPFVPGSEFAGRVDAVGSAVNHLKVGDPVAAIGTSGGFGTHACIKAMQAIPLPPGFALEDAAAFAFTYGTSHHALLDRGQLKAGETVLVLGAAGGVGTAAVQIAKAAGARVIAGASTDEKCEACRGIGADETINYSRDSLRDALKALTGGRGPDIIYDPVGGDLAEPAFRSIAWRGRYLVVGFAAGGIPALPFNLSLLKGASIIGVFWGDFVRREPAANARALGELARWYAEGKIKPLIDTLLPMSELPTAYRRMAERAIKGKLVLVNR
ncbi:MAG TPA: NADPH:quinone oxidoreductase family protein [Ideonella sp.]|uniref:NADPH:quinone oxidoreductase family protein n=1 Tax=Ideonella sp. TaxID=1929293 RepID=UPI002E34F9A7|nr:NADPH:quinone oxidoreductase family protein [Ideonella sp.]HEX5684281.1 NADPH:quinone oxidoreductase family protein [Ideonella sp.]